MPANLANAQSLVEIEDVRENTIILRNGGLRQVLMVSGINFALKSEAEQTVITQAYRDFLNGIDFPLQIIVHSRKINVEKYLQSLKEFATQEPSALLQNQNAEYQEFIRGFVQKNAIMEKSFFVVIPFASVALPTKGSVLGFLPFLKKNAAAEEKAKEEKLADFKANLDQLTQRVEQVQEGLATIGLTSVVLTSEHLVELFYNLYNPEAVEREELPLPTEQQ